MIINYTWCTMKTTPLNPKLEFETCPLLTVLSNVLLASIGRRHVFGKGFYTRKYSKLLVNIRVIILCMMFKCTVYFLVNVILDVCPLKK